MQQGHSYQPQQIGHFIHQYCTLDLQGRFVFRTWNVQQQTWMEIPFWAYMHQVAGYYTVSNTTAAMYHQPQPQQQQPPAAQTQPQHVNQVQDDDQWIDNFFFDGEDTNDEDDDLKEYLNSLL